MRIADNEICQAAEILKQLGVSVYDDQKEQIKAIKEIFEELYDILEHDEALKIVELGGAKQMNGGD